MIIVNSHGKLVNHKIRHLTFTGALCSSKYIYI